MKERRLGEQGRGEERRLKLSASSLGGTGGQQPGKRGVRKTGESIAYLFSHPTRLSRKELFPSGQEKKGCSSQCNMCWNFLCQQLKVKQRQHQMPLPGS